MNNILNTTDIERHRLTELRSFCCMDLVKKSVFDHLGHQTMNSFHCGFTSDTKKTKLLILSNYFKMSIKNKWNQF